MRKLFLLVTIALSMSATSAALASPAPRYLGGDNPFPLTCPQQFDLRSIEGQWRLVNGGPVYTAFAFEGQIDAEKREILRVREFDVVKGEVLAEGIGYRKDRLDVQAIMKGRTGNYMLYVGVYRNVDPTSKYPMGYVAPILRRVPMDSPDGEKAYEIRPLWQPDERYPARSSLTCN